MKRFQSTNARWVLLVIAERISRVLKKNFFFFLMRISYVLDGHRTTVCPFGHITSITQIGRISQTTGNVLSVKEKNNLPKTIVNQ